MGLFATALGPVARAGIYPRRFVATPPEPNFAVNSAGLVLRGWSVNPGRARALIYFGGNNEEVSWLRPHLEDWFPHHTCYLLCYRGFGPSQGKPTEQGLRLDAQRFHDHVAALHPSEKVDVWGRSLGSGVAMQVVALRRVRRLALITPFDSVAATAADLTRLPVSRLIADRWDSVAVADRVVANTEKVLVLRAGQDRIVRPARTDALLTALGTTTQVDSFPDAGHVSIHQNRRYWQTLADFFE